MNCAVHPEEKATHWRKGIARSKFKVLMCLSCANQARDIVGLKVHKIESEILNQEEKNGTCKN